MWEYHGYVLQMSLDYNGGNEYCTRSTAQRPSRTRPRRRASTACRCENARKMADFGRVWGGGTRAVGWPSDEGLSTKAVTEVILVYSRKFRTIHS